jgi:hypothetical protein
MAEPVTMGKQPKVDVRRCMFSWFAKVVQIFQRKVEIMDGEHKLTKHHQWEIDLARRVGSMAEPVTMGKQPKVDVRRCMFSWFAKVVQIFKGRLRSWMGNTS